MPDTDAATYARRSASSPAPSCSRRPERALLYQQALASHDANQAPVATIGLATWPRPISSSGTGMKCTVKRRRDAAENAQPSSERSSTIT